MLGSTPIAAALGAVVPGSVVDDVTAKPLLKELTRQGLHVVLIERDGKTVVDFRNDKERAAALKTWNDAHPNDQREKAPSGVYTSSSNATELAKYIRRYVKPQATNQRGGIRAGFGEGHVNFGLHLGSSNLIVVDADRPSEVDAFVTWYANNCAGGDVSEVPAATVLTPGTTNADGSFDHRDGGHWYFTVPDIVDLSHPDVPAGRTIYVDPEQVAAATGHTYSGRDTEKTQFTVKTGNSYVLIPPSVRPSGAYVFNMPDDPAPIELIDMVTNVDAIASTRPNYSDGFDPFDQQHSADDVAVAGAVASPEGSSAAVATTDSAEGSTDTDRDVSADVDAEGDIVDAADADDGKIIDGVLYRPATVGATLDDQLADWSSSTSWYDVLTPFGWTLNDRTDDCTCETYRRPAGPGESPTPKSMTAHGPTCTRGRTDTRHPACHVWSDHVDGPIGDLIDQRQIAGYGDEAKTLSKFSVYAALNFDNDAAEAMKAIGVQPEYTLAGLQVADDKARRDRPDSEENTVEPTAPVTGFARRDDDTPYPDAGFVSPRPALDRTAPVIGRDGKDVLSTFGIQIDPEQGDIGALRSSWPSIGTLNDFRSLPSPGWLLDNVFELGGLNIVIGDSGSGKSAVIIDLICTIASGRRSWFGIPCASAPVMYIAGEGLNGARDRMVTWEKVNGEDVGDRVLLTDEAVSLNDLGSWGYVTANAIAAGVGVIVVDTLARSLGELEENSATDMSVAVENLRRVQRATGAAVIVVHHTARGATHGRGSTSLRGAADSEVLITKYSDDDDLDLTEELKNGNDPAGRVIDVVVTKQKNGRDDFKKSLCLTDRAAAYHMNPDDAPYTNEERLKRLKAESTAGSFELLDELTVTTLEGYPSTYVELFGTTTDGGGVRRRRSLPTIDDTVAAIIREVNDLDNMRMTETKITKKIGEYLKPHAVSATVWSNHVIEAMNEAMDTSRGNDRIVRHGSYYRMYDPDVDGRDE